MALNWVSRYLMVTLLIATRNPHKVEEIRAILGDAFAYRTLLDLPDAPQVVEDAPTFTGNAIKKAVELAKWIAALPAGFPGPRDPSGTVPTGVRSSYVLADDSGLEVDWLKGAPGVHSARFAALDAGSLTENSSAEANNAKLLRLLSDVPPDQRTGRFRCVLALAPILQPETMNASPACSADEVEMQTEIFEGTCEGKIAFTPSGTNGFGYDPLFIPAGYRQTFAELSESEKNRLSHRAQALAHLKQRLNPA